MKRSHRVKRAHCSSRRFLGEFQQPGDKNDAAVNEAAPIAPPPALFVQRTIFFFHVLFLALLVNIMGATSIYAHSDGCTRAIPLSSGLSSLLRGATTVSCCSRPRERDGVGAGEMPLAGYRAVDAFGSDLTTFV